MWFEVIISIIIFIIFSIVLLFLFVIFLLLLFIIFIIIYSFPREFLNFIEINFDVH